DGVQLEAGTFNSSLTAGEGNWISEARSYQQSYTTPIVLGQVMSYNDPNWSVFWANGNSRGASPNAGNFNAGKNVGEDPNTTRANETIGYVVVEQGNGLLNSIAFDAGVGADNVKGLENNANGFPYPINGLTNPEVAIVSMGAGMDALDGGWPILFGPNAVTPSSLNLLIDEDQVNSTERRHSTEAVSFLVFEGTTPRLRKPGGLDIAVFPNPFQNHLDVRIDGLASPVADVKVGLYNAVGQQVLQRNFSEANFTMMLEDKLPDGVYVMRIQVGQSERVIRVIKQN
ncbi:MAG: T9SS type A sorting domain-containing protein, partial [Bacteroidota bacterium]